ncbi:hypothetical protein NXC14_CH01976 [Rhizobium sp. NXC14]|uniref:hypothetical protein n=1 Tax=Rhizobium sp. NXC14 TaxID=1981173 RepID=UPI000A20B6D1|nr:hypothetical protein [Rhizobium sp. NXC14]ARO29926.1 hypothetical protein NXC14_CH01976 [Rhizobium sp. NXC14]
MKDFIDQELAVGDRVVHGVGGRGGGLSGPYKVVGFTEQMVKIDYKRAWRKEDYSLVAPHCLVKVAP